MNNNRNVVFEFTSKSLGKCRVKIANKLSLFMLLYTCLKSNNQQLNVLIR